MSNFVVVELGASGKIELRGWIGPDTPVKCKSVPGGRWVNSEKCWRYPLDMSVCRALRAAFGADLKVGLKLAAWARDARDVETTLAELGSAKAATLTNVPKLAPRIDTAMATRTYQQSGALFAATAGSCLIADQPGLGKTITALAAIVERNADAIAAGQPLKVLVLAPKVAVTAVWPAEIEQWLGNDALTFTLTGARAQREATLDAALAGTFTVPTFVVGNIEMARIKPVKQENGKPSYKFADGAQAEYPALFSVEWDVIVVDESDRALIKTKGGTTQTRAGMTTLRGKQRIAMSGTPYRGKGERLWGTLNWLRPDLYTSYWNWVARYFTVGSNRYSNYVIGDWRPDGQERLAVDSRAVMIRRTKGEVLAELPPKTYAGSYLIPGDPNSPLAVWLTLEGKQAKLYRDFERDAAVAVEGGDISAAGVLAENTRKKQFAGAACKVENGRVVPMLPSVKFDWLVEKLEEMGILDGGKATGEPGDKIVVASQFTSLLNLFAKELRAMGVGLHLLTGETPDKARQAMVADFQTTDDTRVFLLNTKAGGVAVTLDRADDLVLLDETYIPDDQEQVEDRIHRTSRMHNVTIHNLKILDTIEEEIAWVVAARESVTKYLLDGSRGVETAKALYAAKAAA